MNDARRTYDLAEEPRGDDYRALLAEGVRRCVRASLIQRREVGFDADAQSVLHRLAPSLRDEREVSEWPGTQLLGGTALLREYALSKMVAAALGELVDGLFAWRQPSRPEDLVLWRSDGEAWLVTIAHEGDGYLRLTPAEARDLAARLPPIGRLLGIDPSGGE